MVCKICQDMLGRQSGRLAKGTLDLRYEHHTNVRTFQQSVQQNCYICRALYNSLLVRSKRNTVLQPRADSVFSGTSGSEDLYSFSEFARSPLRSTASLFLHQVDRIYRLEIRLNQNQIQIQHTFHLENWNEATSSPDQHSVHVQYRASEKSPFGSRGLPSSSTRREYGTALRWLGECGCYSPRRRSFYPARLISLENVKASNATYSSSPLESDKEIVVKIIETKSWVTSDGKEAGYNGGNKQYVTLSHCWGGTVSHQLTRDNYNEFTRGIPVRDLPRTFQDAVFVAASMEQVGYLWIDSLCIIQYDEQDWLVQSATMDRVYSETYLNLSATASFNSHGGLFRHGDFKLLEEQDVLLNIEGLPLAYDRKGLPLCLHDRERQFLRHCIIKDATFWEQEVNRGPVNSRGWVLQERLMSPRVLHFCHDQVGWECACQNVKRASAADGKHSSSSANSRSRYDSIVEGIRQKSIDTIDGANAEARMEYSPLDLWAAVVNVYSKTAISHEKDKLIALSGIAKVVAEETKCAYIAGLWRTELANQLLWYVEPVFHPVDRSFVNPATFPKKYPERAPSFSWAAIDVTGHGLIYAKAANRNFVIRIEDTSVETLTDNEFGVTSKARIFVWGKLCAARLSALPNNRFGWHLVNREDLNNEIHRNVYLDCPPRDLDCIDNLKARVYVLPVARERSHSGTSPNEYLYCLILRPGVEKGTFRRIGMTKLSPFGDPKAMKSQAIDGKADYKILETLSSSDALPQDVTYDRKTGMHRICLV